MFAHLSRRPVYPDMIILGVILLGIPFVYAQSWDIHTWPESDGGEAEVVSVDRSQNALTLKFYTNRAADEFKLVSCFVDNSSVIEKGETQVGISQLAPGMKVSSGGGIYRQSVRSCENLKVLTENEEGLP